jgi:hypothetical protein
MELNNSQQRAYEFFDEDDDLASGGQRLDLIDLQRRILTSMLNLRGDAGEEDDEGETEVSVGDGQSVNGKALTFKVLILDQMASNVVASVMKVGALRECNVTLHLGLNQKREQVPDIPAVYLLCNFSHPSYYLSRFQPANLQKDSRRCLEWPV